MRLHKVTVSACRKHVLDVCNREIVDIQRKLNEVEEREPDGYVTNRWQPEVVRLNAELALALADRKQAALNYIRMGN